MINLKLFTIKVKQIRLKLYLDKLAAKISAFSSGDLRKDEYLTGEDLGYKPSVVEQAKFEYSRLGKIFNKGLKNKTKKKDFLRG